MIGIISGVNTYVRCITHDPDCYYQTNQSTSAALMRPLVLEVHLRHDVGYRCFVVTLAINAFLSGLQYMSNVAESTDFRGFRTNH